MMTAPRVLAPPPDASLSLRKLVDGNPSNFDRDMRCTPSQIMSTVGFDPIHRILIIHVRAAFSSRIQISLLEVHGGRVQSMVATNGALRPLSSGLGSRSVNRTDAVKASL
jgi:hypothetical protein